MGLGVSRERLVWQDYALLASAIFLALAMRLYQLPHEEVWVDEIGSLQFLNEPSLSEFLNKERADDPAMVPVYYALEYGWSRTFGPSAQSMRLLSALFGVLAVPLLFLVGRSLCGKAAGHIAAFMLALSIVHIYYSQEIRSYALVSLLALGSVFSFVRAADGARRPSWLIVHTAANLLLIFTHLFSAFLIAAEGIWLLVTYRRHFRSIAAWIVSNALIAGLLVAWLHTANYGTVNERLGWIQHPSPVDLARIFFGYALGYLDRTFFVVPKLRPLHLALGIVPLFLAARYLVHALRRRSSEEGAALLLLMLWLLLPPLSLFALSFVGKPCFVSRYVMYSSFPIYILAGAGLGAIPGRRRRILSMLVLAAVCGYAASAVTISPFRGMGAMGAAERLGDAKPADVVIIDGENFDTCSLSYYWPQIMTRGQRVFGEEAVVGLLQPIHGRGATAWIVSADNPSKVKTLSKALATLDPTVEDWEFGDTMLGGIRVFKVH